MNSSHNKQLHLLLNQLKLNEQKKSLVFSFTNGRTESSRAMHHEESLQLIAWLRSQSKDTDSNNRQRRLIIHYAHQMGWELEDGKADMERINAWCIKFGMFKKPLNDHDASELPKLVTQFEKVYLSFLKGI